MIAALHAALGSGLAASLAAGAAGLVAGALFFGALAWSVERMLSGRMQAALGLHVLRWVCLVGLLTLAARAGAGPLCAMALGVLAARWLGTVRPGIGA